MSLKNKYSIKLLLFCVYVDVFVYMCATSHVEITNNLRELVLSFHSVGLEDETWVIHQACEASTLPTELPHQSVLLLHFIVSCYVV